MTTKPAAAVQAFTPEALEKIAYSSVSTIPTEEPNDRNRLGYHIWRWLSSKQGSLEKAIAESGSRLKITQQETLRIIQEELKKQGVLPS